MLKTSMMEVGSWIENVENGLSGGDCYCPSFLKPYHFLTLATQLKRHAETQLNLPNKLLHYAIRMRLWDAIDAPVPYGIHKSDENAKFLPLMQLKSLSQIQKTSDKLLEILEPYCSNSVTINSLNCMLLELLGNCFAHAAVCDDLHGLACCQPWPKGKLAQIALVDGGIGIRKSLSGNAALIERLNRENCCELATQYGVTSKPNQGHAGYGLALTRGLMEQNFGNLIIVSGSEVFQSCDGVQKSFSFNTSWRGTIILLEFNTNQTLNIEKIYRQWPVPAGFTEDDLYLGDSE